MTASSIKYTLCNIMNCFKVYFIVTKVPKSLFPPNHLTFLVPTLLHILLKRENMCFNLSFTVTHE